MKITLASFDFSGTGSEEVSDLRGSGSRQVQVAELLRAQHARVYQRNNEITRISFAVTRKHDSLQAAQEFLITHPLEFPRTGKLVIQAMEPGTDERTLFTAETAAIEGWDYSHIGVTTIFSYKLVIGEPKRNRTGR